MFIIIENNPIFKVWWQDSNLPRDDAITPPKYLSNPVIFLFFPSFPQTRPLYNRSHLEALWICGMCSPVDGVFFASAPV